MIDAGRVAHGFAMKYGLREHLTYEAAMGLERDLTTYLRAVLSEGEGPDPEWTQDADGYVVAPLVNEGTL